MQKDSLGFLITDVSRLMRRHFQRYLQDSSLTLAQARALVYVSRHEGVRQVDLADMLEIQPITLARLLDQLEKADLVERRPNPTDRRAHQVYLAAGAAVQLAIIEQVGSRIKKEALQSIHAEQAEGLMETLRTIRHNLCDTR